MAWQCFDVAAWYFEEILLEIKKVPLVYQTKTHSLQEALKSRPGFQRVLLHAKRHLQLSRITLTVNLEVSHPSGEPHGHAA